MWLLAPSVLLVALVACLWRILEKLGLPGFLCVLFFLPVVNVVFLAYVAFADRPAKAPPPCLRNPKAEPSGPRRRTPMRGG